METKYSRNFFLLLFFLILTVNLCSYSMVSSRVKFLIKNQSSTSNLPSDEYVIKSIQENPSKILSIQIIGFLVLLGMLFGLMLDIDYIRMLIRNKSLGILKNFPNSNVSLSSIGKVLILVIFFFSILKFIQISFIDIAFKHRFIFAFLFQGLLQILSILAIFFLFNKEAFGVRKHNLFHIAGFCVKSYISLLPILALVLVLNIQMFRFIDVKPPSFTPVTIMLKEKNIFILIILAFEAVFLAPVFEELIFRGLFYGFLRRRLPFFISSLISGLVFSLLHENPFAVLPITVLGMALAFVYEQKKNLLYPIALHSIHNLLISIVILVIKPF